MNKLKTPMQSFSISRSSTTAGMNYTLRILVPLASCPSFWLLATLKSPLCEKIRSTGAELGGAQQILSNSGESSAHSCQEHRSLSFVSALNAGELITFKLFFSWTSAEDPELEVDATASFCPNRLVHSFFVGGLSSGARWTISRSTGRTRHKYSEIVLESCSSIGTSNKYLISDIEKGFTEVCITE